MHRSDDPHAGRTAQPLNQLTEHTMLDRFYSHEGIQSDVIIVLEYGMLRRTAFGIGGLAPMV